MQPTKEEENIDREDEIEEKPKAVLGSKFKETIQDQEDEIERLKERLKKLEDANYVEDAEYFDEFFPESGDFYIEMIKENNFDEFNDKDFWLDWYGEIEYVYRHLKVMQPQYFLKDLKTQIRRMMPKIRLLKQVKDKPLEDIDDIITKSISTSKSQENSTPFQDTYSNAYDDKGNLTITNAQSNNMNESYRTSNVNMQKQIINNDFTNGLRELAKNLSTVFKSVLDNREHMNWHPNYC